MLAPSAALRLGDRFAQPPQCGALREAAAITASCTRPASIASASARLEQAAQRRVVAGGGNLAQHVSVVRRSSGSPTPGMWRTASSTALRGRSSKLVTRIAGRGPQAAEQPHRGGEVGTARNAVSTLRGRGNSFRLAAVITPSVPSAPMNRSRRS